MPSKPPVHRAAHALSTKQARSHADRWRGSASSRGYDRDWQKLRDAYLFEHPLCVFCEAKGLVTAAREVDHIITIAERPDLRLEPTNLRALCTPCHSGRTARDQAGSRRSDGH